ncbi:MAG: DUF3276 family protein, partial [Spirochaetaceae bacterium]
MGQRGELFSSRAQSEKRMFFFNVKENRRGDVFLNIVESKRAEGAPESDRHQIVVYQEELDDFYSALTEAVEHIRTSRWNAFRAKRRPAPTEARSEGRTENRSEPGTEKRDSSPPVVGDKTEPKVRKVRVRLGKKD